MRRFGDIPDLTGVSTRDEMRETVRRSSSDASDGRWPTSPGQLWALRSRVRPGDVVVMPLRWTAPRRYRAPLAAAATRRETEAAHQEMPENQRGDMSDTAPQDGHGPVHHLVLVTEGRDLLEDDILEALYEAGCTDASIGHRTVGFDREAPDALGGNPVGDPRCRHRRRGAGRGCPRQHGRAAGTPSRARPRIARSARPRPATRAARAVRAVRCAEFSGPARRLGRLRIPRSSRRLVRRLLA